MSALDAVAWRGELSLCVAVTTRPCGRAAMGEAGSSLRQAKPRLKCQRPGRKQSWRGEGSPWSPLVSCQRRDAVFAQAARTLAGVHLHLHHLVQLRQLRWLMCQHGARSQFVSRNVTMPQTVRVQSPIHHTTTTQWGRRSFRRTPSPASRPQALDLSACRAWLPRRTAAHPRPRQL